jgi:hypothetical protein
MENETEDNVVEMLRAIRDQKYEEIKHMTREEQRAYIEARTAKGAAAFEARLANAKPDYERFPFLAKK